MAQNRVAGLISLKVDGQIYNAKGNFTYNLGRHKKEAVIGADGVHGYKETPQVPFIEGEITDRAAISLQTLCDIENATVTLELANGKVIVIRGAWFAADGTANTEESNVGIRFEGMSGEEIR